MKRKETCSLKFHCNSSDLSTARSYCRKLLQKSFSLPHCGANHSAKAVRETAGASSNDLHSLESSVQTGGLNYHAQLILCKAFLFTHQFTNRKKDREKLSNSDLQWSCLGESNLRYLSVKPSEAHRFQAQQLQHYQNGCERYQHYFFWLLLVVVVIAQSSLNGKKKKRQCHYLPMW